MRTQAEPSGRFIVERIGNGRQTAWPGKRIVRHHRRLPSKRWQVRYTGPDGVRRNAPHTFATRDRRRGWVAVKRREIDAGRVGRHRRQPTRAGHVRRLRCPLAGQPAGRRADRSRPAPASTTSAILDAPSGARRSATGSSPRSSPKDVRDWYEHDAGRPADHAAATPTRCCGRSWRRGQRRADRREPVPHRRRRPGQAGAPDPARQRRRAGDAHRGDARTAAADGHVGVWCALRFGETVELRRGDIDLSRRGDPGPPRGGAHQRRATSVTTPKSDAGMRDVAIPPHIIPLIEAHLAKHVGDRP